MNREDFMRALAEVIRPRSAQAGATILLKMLSFLSDLGDDAFTDESLRYIAPRLPRSPNIGQLRTALNAYLQQAQPQSERDDESPTLKARREHEERQAFLRDDWDDVARIMRKVRDCDDGTTLGHRHLMFLAKVVAKFAPQHLGLLPPRIIEEVAGDPEVTLPAIIEVRQPRTAYLTEEQLDAAYGRKRNATPAAAVDPAPAEGVDEDKARYPARC